MSEHPWRDEDRLYRAYIEEDKTQPEIADEWGCHQGTISNWLDKFGIEKTNPWDDEERLRELYHGKKLSTREIGERLGTTGSTIQGALKRNGIEIRNRHEAHQMAMWRGPAPFGLGSDGYERWKVTIDRKSISLYHHRLLAVAEYGYDAVEDSEVHHKNGLKWDNRTENIELMDRTEHRKHHADETDGYIGKNLHLAE